MTEETAKTIEVRFHGRGGQGVVTAAKLLAETAMKEGKYFQALPEYGPERMGAPIRAYARISSLPIILHCLITEPDIVVVTDPTLVDFVNVTEGITKDGIIVINTPLSPAEIRSKVNYTKGKVGTVDATKIALDTLKRNIPNVPILGALLKVTEIVDKERLVNTIKYKLGTMTTPEMVEANIQAFEQGYNQCRID